MIFDSHAHYDAVQFDEDRDAILSLLEENGIERVINVCADVKDWHHTVELTEKYPFVYGAAGVHPNDVCSLDEEHMKELRSMCQLEKIAAVGEIGLDYYWEKDPEKQEEQKYWFVRQLQLAREEKLPFMIHSRDAAKDTLDLMKDQKAGEIGGVVHCFSYGKEMAREFLNMGLYLGIGGVITFGNAKKLKEVVAYAPMESLLLETDCPYLAPAPNRGKRNSSLNLPYVAQMIAEVKRMEYDEVVEITAENAYRLFSKVKK